MHAVKRFLWIDNNEFVRRNFERWQERRPKAQIPMTNKIPKTNAQTNPFLVFYGLLQKK